MRSSASIAPCCRGRRRCWRATWKSAFAPLGRASSTIWSAALAGGYLPGGNGGEPIRNPDAYPTGKNFYGIDPDKVPKPPHTSWA